MSRCIGRQESECGDHFCLVWVSLCQVGKHGASRVLVHEAGKGTYLAPAM